jgi:O-antigen/teichoic acid export membrane protein
MGPDALGLYHLAYQFASGLQMLVTAVNGAIMPSFVRMRQDSSDEEIASIGRLSGVFLSAMVVMSLSLSAIVPAMLAWLSPAEYGPSAPLIPWLMTGILLFAYYCIPANVLTMSLGHTRGIGWFTGLAALLNVGLNVMLLPHLGLPAAVAATILSYLAMVIGVHSYTKTRTALLGQLLEHIGSKSLAVVTVAAYAGIVLVQRLPSAAAAVVGSIMIVAVASATISRARWQQLRHRT